MMEQLISYQLVLNKSQADYLAASKYGINRMQALVSLLELVKTADGEYTMKGFSTPLKAGQFVASEVELSHLWKCDRKTVSRVLDQMNRVGLVSTVQNNRTSIHALLCVASWYIDGWSVRNGFYRRLSDRSAGNINEGKGRMG